MVSLVALLRFRVLGMCQGIESLHTNIGEGSAENGCPAKSSRFERGKFKGYGDAPFVDVLTGVRTI